MSYDEDLKHLLIAIDDESFDEDNILPEYSRDKVMRMLNDCDQQGFISHSSPTQRIVTGFMDGKFMLHPTTFVTRQGKKFVEGNEDSVTPTHQYNIHSVSGSNFGDNGSVTINYGASLSDIQSLIEEIHDVNDKQEATVLVKTLEEETIKPGLLKKFDNLLGKYPEIAKASGQFLLSIATGQFSN